MYSNGFVACIKTDGSFVKELENGQVNLEFGSEYTLQ